MAWEIRSTRSTARGSSARTISSSNSWRPTPKRRSTNAFKPSRRWPLCESKVEYWEEHPRFVLSAAVEQIQKLKAHFGVDFGELKYPTMKPKGLRRPRRNPSSNTGRRNGGPSSLAFRRGIGRPAVGRVGDVAGELRFERGDGLVLALRAASTATMAAPAPVIGRARPEPLARTRSVPFTKEPADGIGPKESRREVIRLGIAAHHGPRARSARRDRARSAPSRQC